MKKTIKDVSRRDFIKTSVGVATGLAVVNPLFAKAYQIPLGICGSYEKAGLFAAVGCDFFEDNVSRFLIPEQSDAEFDNILKLHNSLPIKSRSFVSFFPGNMRAVGPELHHEAMLERADKSLERAKACGASNIVFGSGGSRRIPDGFDAQKAKEQFIELCKKMAPLAAKHGITISLEPLNKGETNFINSLADGAEIVQAVNQPYFKLLADIYHMMREDEPASEIVKYKKIIVHTHIAEKENRTAPGIAGDDFRPYLKALQKAKYKGGLSLECRWQNIDEEAAIGIKALREQMASL